eukprot:658902-Prorocentrum_minimum.AAC.1
MHSHERRTPSVPPQYPLSTPSTDGCIRVRGVPPQYPLSTPSVPPPLMDTFAAEAFPRAAGPRGGF